MKAKDLTRPRTVATCAILAMALSGCDSGSSDDGGGDGANPTGGGGGTEIQLGNVLMIDDLEADEAGVIDGYFFDLTNCWEGAWFTYADGTGGATISPALKAAYIPEMVDVPRPGTTYAAHTVGGGFADWGAGTGINLRIYPEGGISTSAFPGDNGECLNDVHPGPSANCLEPTECSAFYNAYSRGFTGIGFVLRSGNGQNQAVSLKVPTAEVVPLTRDGTCDTATQKCDDAYGANIMITPEWTLYQFRWGELKQEGFGTVVPFNSQMIQGFQWQTASGATFDVWIDDVHWLLD